jgi:hypothetical protein
MEDNQKKVEIALEIRDLTNELMFPENFSKVYYQDLRHIRNSMRKALREVKKNV